MNINVMQYLQLNIGPLGAWTCLALAGILEVMWLITATYSKGFTDLKWTLITLAFLPVSLFLFTQSLKFVPVGTAYAVWTGLGAAGGALAGIVIFHESATPLRLLCISGIILCIVVLKLSAPVTQTPEIQSKVTAE